MMASEDVPNAPKDHDLDSEDLFASHSAERHSSATVKHQPLGLFDDAEDEIDLNDPIVPISSPADQVTSANNMSTATSLFDSRTPLPADSPVLAPTQIASPVPLKNDHGDASVSPFGAGGISSPVSPIDPTKSRRKKEEEDEPDDPPQPAIEINVKEPERRGDGMNSFIVYKVTTQTNSNPGFSKREYEVWRRFSDFLGLHNKLVAKHLPNGRIVPPAPEKSVFGTTKTKISKTVEDEGTQEFLERRRAALERFLRRVAQHPVLQQDPDFREFLTFDTELPKASQTATLSGANFVKLLGRVGDSITKITVKMEETDSWFEDKQNEIETLDEQLRKLHSSMELLVHFRRELATNTDAYCKSMSMLAACEENTALSRAFSQLAETQEKIGMVHSQQADKDFYIMAETLKDYIAIIGAVKDVFNERHKNWSNWQNAQQTLTKKREAKTKFELQGRADKLPQAKKEVEEWEHKVQECEEGFQRICKLIRKEVRRFDGQRIKDFKEMIVQYLESLALTQQQVIKYWEAFLPEAKSING